MLKSKFFIAALAAASLTCTGAQAAGVLDQDSAPGGGNLGEFLNWQQEVTSGMAGRLTGITLYGLGTTALVRVAEGSGFHTGPFAFSQTVTLASGGTFIDTSAANIMLDAGEQFVIDTSGGYGGNIHYALTPYSGGQFFLNLGVPSDYTACCRISLAFQTFIEAPKGGGAVPEPASWAMLLLGFGALGGVLRRRRAFAAA